ncbi:MAG: trypsin-like peptidase domain-containing protein, partial [Chloroflexi bacterium]|nr:trypsin-like peptidase domain-containing protein [Chloroflexota bacterium]
DEGARLLRIALRDTSVTGGIRAVACLWLAETVSDPQSKRAYYDEALAADPDNPDIRHRVERWLASQLPTPPAPTQPLGTGPLPPSPTAVPPAQPPVSPPVPTAFGQPADAPPAFSTGGAAFAAQPSSGFAPARVAGVGYYHIVGIIGGPNGPGTAFFITQEGLLATTRHVVGGLEHVTVELETGLQVPGRVVRSHPELDLALVYVQQPVSELMPITPLPRIPEETPLMAVAYNGQMARGSLRTTTRVLAAHWFPTTITQRLDAGGNPVFDDNRYLVGMLTRNASATSPNLYGVHINAIRKLVETFKQEMTEKRQYCPACGAVSKAAAAGGYYCETCGSLMAYADRRVRGWRDAGNVLYHEQNRIACRHCSATAGFHRGLCLRCGREQT